MVNLKFVAGCRSNWAQGDAGGHLAGRAGQVGRKDRGEHQEGRQERVQRRPG